MLGYYSQSHFRCRPAAALIFVHLYLLLFCEAVAAFSFSTVRLGSSHQLWASLRRGSAGSSHLRASAISSQEVSLTEIPVHKCGFCDATFASRNAMFRHIRADPDCAVAAGETQPPKRQRLAFLFGYHNVEAEESGNMLLTFFLEALESSLKVKPELLRNTQSTVPRSRPSSLGLESDCPAAEDVLVVAFMAPDETYNSNFEDILAATRASLVNSGVTLHACKPLPPGMHLHAEQSCTQHIFHYLVPINWLPDSESILSWRKNQLLYSEGRNTNIPSPPSLRRMKEALRSAESKKVKGKASDGRFKALAHKEKRPWHNYADPDLVRGVEASPSNEPVWRALDRARFHSFIDGDSEESMCIVYEFAGDEFLKQQVRRIIGTAIAMTHGWLPEDFIQATTTREVVIETPLAPGGHLYRACTRFHFEEMSLNGLSIFDSDEVYQSTPDSVAWMQQKLIENIEKRPDTESEEVWLTELRESVAPRISGKLEAADIGGKSQESSGSYDPDIISAAAPDEYESVLRLLQDIVETKRWPSTSVARSTVITNVKEAEQSRAGSFTVANMKCTIENLPLANSLLPDLTAAIFRLEACLAEAAGDAEGMSAGKRPPSSHCAVNCNAQFVPHVDSGRGAGQSLSMIVGLGDYQGGELMVEGDVHDIRYSPLQFDGWNLRHWTKPFAGQRFSLVWFTPEETSKKSE
jgi:tRNA U38,U39,U40 pseudouridine synthase TruA